MAAVFLIVFEAGAGHGRIRQLATRQHLQYYVSNIKYEILCISNLNELFIKYQILGIEYEFLIWVGNGVSWIREIAICTCDPKISSQSLIMQLLLENADFLHMGAELPVVVKGPRCLRRGELIVSMDIRSYDIFKTFESPKSYLLSKFVNVKC